MKLVEPLRELFKDEVRVIGKELGLPEAFVSRHPFGPRPRHPHPGEVTKERCEILRKADAVISRRSATPVLHAIWQAFGLLPVKNGRRDGRRAPI